MNQDRSSEGPYTSGLPANAAVINKKLGCAYTGIEERSVNAVCNWMNEAYAEGRKAAEKEFKELLETTEYVVDRIGDSGPFGQMHALEKFRAWKKVRGIE